MLASARSAWTRFAPHLRGTTRSALGHDALAGVTIAAVAVPQAIAYALVAGLPPEMGLVAAAWPCAVAALFGSSPHLVTGPTNPTALMLGVSVVAPALAAGRAVPVDDVVATGLLVGLMLVGLALAGVGRTSRFLSDSVVIGFATGAGVLIALRLLPALAPSLEATPSASGWMPTSWPVLVDAARALAEAGPRTLALAIATPAVAWGLRRVDPRVPGALIALAAATVAAAGLGWTEGPRALAPLPSGPPGVVAPGLPGTVDLGRLAGPAFAIALLVTLQSVASARSVRPRDASFRLDVDRELFGQGAGNLVSALLGGMVTSGSLTRSAVGRGAGGRSRLAAVVAGAGLALGLPYVGALVSAVPMAALVGLVCLSGLELVRWHALRRAATTRGDALVLVATLGATLCVDLVQALYVGVFLSLALLVRRSGHLQMVELVRGAAGRVREIPLDARSGRTPVVLLQVEGDLNFAVAQALTDRLLEIGRRRPRVIVLRVKRVAHLDATVLEALREATIRLAAHGTRLVLCGLNDDHVALLAGTELASALGEEGLVRSGTRLFEGFEEALRRARRLAGDGPEATLFRQESTAPAEDGEEP